MPIDNLPDGVYMVNLSNPTEVDNFLRQICGETSAFPVGKTPSDPNDGDYPNAEDCSVCSAKGCLIREVPYGSTTPAPAPTLREVVERSVKNKALRDALKTEKPKAATFHDDVMAMLRAERVKVDLKYREAKLAQQAMAPDAVLADGTMFGFKTLADRNGFTSKDLAEAARKMYGKAASDYLWPSDAPMKGLSGDPSKDKMKKPVIKPMFSEKFAKEMEDLASKLDAVQKKARDDAQEALAEKLYARLSKHFYRDRAARYSRTAELLSQVNSLTEESRKLKADLRAKDEAMTYYKRAVANPESVSWNTSHDKATGAFVYVTGYEFDTLKALADGSATVIPTSKKDVVANATTATESGWFHFVDPETGSLTVPMLNAWVVVKTGFVTTRVMQRVEADHERAIRLNHRPGGVSLWFNPKGDTFTPFDLAEAEWRYGDDPAPSPETVREAYWYAFQGEGLKELLKVPVGSRIITQKPEGGPVLRFTRLPFETYHTVTLYGENGEKMFFEPMGDLPSDFDQNSLEWNHYDIEPAPDMAGIPLDHMV